MKEAEQRPGTLSLVKMPLNPPRMFLWSESRNKDGLCACFNSHSLTLSRFRSPANQSKHRLCLVIIVVVLLWMACAPVLIDSSDVFDLCSYVNNVFVSE